jgi:hypothetical protein
MRTRNRPAGQDQHRKNRAGRDGVAQERECAVPARELQRHDDGADDGCEEACRSGRFGGETAREVGQVASFALSIAPSVRPL